MKCKEFDGGLQSNHEISIGIDQSLSGFALSAVSIELPSQHITWVYKSPFTGVQRLDDIQTFMFEKLEWLKARGNSVKDIAMEGTVLASQAALVLGELAATVKLFLFEHFLDNNHYVGPLEPHLRTPLQIPPMTLKKYATGKGTSKKQEMLLQIYKRWGVEFNDDNAADAYSLGRLATGSHIDAVEKAVIEQIKDVKYRDFVA
jgi:Holliday junction resolvasome RuvABC endonuclease subunit